MSSIVTVDSIPGDIAAKTISIYWYCKRKTERDEFKTIAIYAAVEAFKKEAGRVFVRKGMHPGTYAEAEVIPGARIVRTVVPDERGFHFTAELQIKKGDWLTWHHYFEKTADVWKLNTSVPNNPGFYEESHGRSNTVQTENVPRDRVMVFAKGNTYYVKLIPDISAA